MLRSFSGLVLALCLGFVPAGRLCAKPLPNDTRILSGTLTNGVRWYYRQHDNPPGKMALMIHVRTGSLNETEEQRGLAHFLEHMGFNGTEHFPPGKLIPYFESIGMQFGADLNAYTSFDQTVYLLYTPDTTSNQIDKALMVLSDYAFRASFLPAEIDKERGVVLEEARSGKSAQQRIRDKLWPQLLAGSRFATRLPIGDEKVIAGLPRDEFAAYYASYYRPENVTVLLSGDAPPDGIIPLIAKWFGEAVVKTPAGKTMGPELKAFSKETAFVVTDPEMAYCETEMLKIRPGRPPTITDEQWRVELVEYVGNWILNRRHDDRVRKGEASYRGAGASVGNFFNDAVIVDSSASGEPVDWEKMLSESIIEVKRALEFGFTSRELALARQEILAGAERAVRTEPTRNARSIVSEMVSAVNDRIPVLSAAQKLELYRKFLPEIELAEVNRSFKENFAPGSFAYVVTMIEKEGVKVPGTNEVLAAAQRSWKTQVETRAEQAAPTALMESPPKPGKVLETKEDPDLKIVSGWLSNGVRFHYRFMDYKKDSVMVSISLAGGQIEETSTNAGVSQVASLAISDAATSRLTSTQMRDLMTGKNIHVGGGPDGDSFSFSITGSPQDLESGLQKAFLLLTDGKIEEASFKNWRLSTLQAIEQREKVPGFKASEALEELLSSGDPRRMPLGKARVEALTLRSGQEWFDRLTRQAPIEVAVVGDLSWEKTKPLLEQYLGGLPAHPRNADYLAAKRNLKRAKGPQKREVRVETVTPQAVAFAGFASSEGKNAFDTRALDLAANILTSRLIKKIREEMGIVYSIGAGNSESWIYRDAGRFLSGAPCDPTNSTRVIEEVHRQFRAFADQAPTGEEMTNAQKQIANHLDVSMREPGYWWGVLRHHDLHGRDLAEEKRVKEAFASLTAEQVQEVFKKYYIPERQFSVSAFPTGAKSP